MSLQQISEHVWVFPPDKDQSKVRATVGIVCTPTQTVLIDSSNSPANARLVIEALKGIHAPPISHIIYTHHHWDHTFGAMVYNVPVVAHMVCQFRLVQYASNPWGPDFIERAIAEAGGLRVGFRRMAELLKDEWDTFKIIHPSIIIHKKLDLFPLDGGINLIIEHIGGAHSDDSTLITVQEDGVMFLGDCFYAPADHVKKPGDKPDWDMLNRLLDRDLAMYVDGHSGAYSQRTWRELIRLNR